MSLPLVSVLIPVFNRPDTLQTAIESVLQQTYPHIELIICDDSTDSRVEDMMKPYLESSKKIKYYKNGQHLPIKNWQICYDLASGEYINYLMDDDVFHEEKIEKMIYFFNEFENIKLVASYHQTIDEKGERLPPLLETERLFEEVRILDGKELANIALTRCSNVIGTPTSVLFRKSDLKVPFGVYHGKQYSFLNDMAAWLNLLSEGKAVYIPEALSYFLLPAKHNKNVPGFRAFREWQEIIMAARKERLFKTKEQYKTALMAYHARVKKKSAIWK